MTVGRIPVLPARERSLSARRQRPWGHRARWSLHRRAVLLASHFRSFPQMRKLGRGRGGGERAACPSVWSLEGCPAHPPPAASSVDPARQEEGRGKEERIKSVQPQTSQGDVLSSSHGSRATVGVCDPSAADLPRCPRLSRSSTGGPSPRRADPTFTAEGLSTLVPLALLGLRGSPVSTSARHGGTFPRFPRPARVLPPAAGRTGNPTRSFPFHSVWPSSCFPGASRVLS